MRPRMKREIKPVYKKGSFGICKDCRTDILFYGDNGVKCSNCGKLYATWGNRNKNPYEIINNPIQKYPVEKNEQEDLTPVISAKPFVDRRYNK